MSSDNYNNLIQRSDGRWILSTNHSMSDLMCQEEYEAYKRALAMTRADSTVYDTQAEAYAAADMEDSEYGTFSHHYHSWFENMGEK